MSSPTGPGGRPRSQRSVVFPSPVVLLSIVAVAMALVAFVATRGGEPTEREVVAPAANPSASAAPATPSATPTTEPTATPRPRPIRRADHFVEVYNNSGITGLAGTVGEQANDAGWNVVGTDNWYGSVPTNTVYYPPKLSRVAKQLALDLGIDRTAPADGAMKLDRLTVILTGAL